MKLMKWGSLILLGLIVALIIVIFFLPFDIKDYSFSSYSFNYQFDV